MDKLPESHHRFDIGKDKEVRSRIRLVQESVREMQKEHPEILSFAMFGSIVKGYATSESDVDGNVFVNLETDPKKLMNPKAQARIFWHPLGEINLLNSGELQVSPSLIEAEVDGETFKVYKEYAQKKIKDKVPNLKEEQIKHIFVLPISFQMLDELLKQWGKSASHIFEMKSVEAKVRKKYKNGISDQELSDEMHRKGYGIPDNNIVASEYLSKLFFLDVGSGALRPYRSHVIKKLFSFGAVGHEMWKKIIAYTEIIERKINPDDRLGMTEDQFEKGVFTKVRYPRTLEEAKKIYG